MIVAAIDTANFDGSYLCGAYVHVTGPQGEVTVRIVDSYGLPEQSYRFERRGFWRNCQPVAGHCANHVADCQPQSGFSFIAYHFKDGSNQWWTAVQIRNHRNPIAKFDNFSGLF